MDELLPACKTICNETIKDCKCAWSVAGSFLFNPQKVICHLKAAIADNDVVLKLDVGKLLY